MVRVWMPSFVNPINPYCQKLDYWSPAIISDWPEANAIGSLYGEEAVTWLRTTGNPILLGHILKAIVGKGAFGGVEVGFAHRLSEHLILPYQGITGPACPQSWQPAHAR